MRSLVILDQIIQAHFGKRALMIWLNDVFNDLVKPLENIDSDRIIGIRFDFNEKNPLFILSVYMPASSHCIEEFNEYLHYLWALYDSLSTGGFVILMGGLNGDLGEFFGW